jgi:hypothetical protein
MKRGLGGEVAEAAIKSCVLPVGVHGGLNGSDFGSRHELDRLRFRYLKASTYSEKALKNRMFALESVKPVLGEDIAGIEIEELQCHWALVHLIKGTEHKGEASTLLARKGIYVYAL